MRQIKKVYKYDAQQDAIQEMRIQDDPKNIGQFPIPEGWIEEPPPEIGDNQKAVQEGVTWKIVSDYRGVIYNIETKESDTILDYDVGIPEGFTNLTPEQFSTWNKDKWEFSLYLYKDHVVKELSARCKYERSLILDDIRIMNILSGADSGYPEYLTVSNVKILIEKYKEIYHSNVELINSKKSKKGVDDVINNLTFPTEQEILDEIK